METKFLRIKTEYDSFYNKMLSEGKIPMKETEKGFWGISTAEDVYALFKKIDLQKYNSFVDLGSGDGKPTLIASLFTKAEGIEIDHELVQHSIAMNKKLGLKAKFHKKDFLSHDLTSYDILFIHPDQHMINLEPKLLKELKGKLVVMSPHYHPKILKKTDNFIANTQPVFIFENF